MGEFGLYLFSFLNILKDRKQEKSKEELRENNMEEIICLPEKREAEESPIESPSPPETQDPYHSTPTQDPYQSIPEERQRNRTSNPEIPTSVDIILDHKFLHFLQKNRNSMRQLRKEYMPANSEPCQLPPSLQIIPLFNKIRTLYSSPNDPKIMSELSELSMKYLASGGDLDPHYDWENDCPRTMDGMIEKHTDRPKRAKKVEAENDVVFNLTPEQAKDPKVKLKIVMECRAGGITQTARKYGLVPPRVNYWVRAYEQFGAQGLEDNRFGRNNCYKYPEEYRRKILKEVMEVGIDEVCRKYNLMREVVARFRRTTMGNLI